MDAEAAIRTRNPGIDALRGLCIVLVVVHHLALRVPLHKTALAEVLPRRVLDAFGYNGYEAVFVFFVISGFLIASHAMRRPGGLARMRVGEFYLRRISRIAPLLLALVVVLASMHLAGVPFFVIDNPAQSLPGATLSALGLYLNWYEGRTGWLPGGWDVLWSLSIEEAFYMAFPPICLLLARRRWVFTALLAAFALSLPVWRAALAGSEIWQEKAYLPGMAAIATGVLVALLLEGRRLPRRTALMLRWAGALGLLAVALCGRELWASLGEGCMLVLTGSAAMLLAGLQGSANPSAIPGMALLRKFGRLSYEIYLTHMFVVFALVALFRASGGDLRLGAWWYLPLLAATGGLGMLVARAFSDPCERALRRRWLGSDVIATVAPARPDVQPERSA